MKFRFSFTIKIILPYLVLASLFLIIFLSEVNQGHTFVTVLSASGVAVSVLVAVIHVFWLKRPLFRMRELIVQLSRGKLPAFTASRAADEIGDLERNLEKHVSHLQFLTKSARDVASGNFSGSFEKLSAEDEMGAALLSLKESLEDSMKIAESKRGEEENRTWNAQGLAKFSKLFREAEDDLEELSRELMRELVSYTDADVGALFIAGESETGKPELELIGSYAFDREKYIDRTFEFGEGLVGRAALEKEVIHVTDLPPETIKIRSGLGEDVPSSILLVPVMLDNKVMGVIELATLSAMPSHQIEFMKQLGDALATTLAKVKANLQTKQQAEALSSQEMVFRQNLQELEKAQQTFSRREKKLLQDIEKLQKS